MVYNDKQVAVRYVLKLTTSGEGRGRYEDQPSEENSDSNEDDDEEWDEECFQARFRKISFFK